MNVRYYLFAAILLVDTGCSNPQKTAPPTPPAGTKASIDTGRRVAYEPSPVKSVSASTAFPSAGTWVYKETVGETGVKAYTASITSADILTFEKPFDGGATATLTVRKRNGSTTVSLSVSNGQFTSSFQAGQVRIRFDNSASALYPFTPASNGNTDIIFLDPVEILLRKLKVSEKTVINAGFYGQGTRTITFKTAGFRWKG